MNDRSTTHPPRAARRKATSRPAFLTATLLGALLGFAGTARANTQVDPFYGAFGTEVDIEVPKFRSLEPAVKLTYSSTGANGLAGIGWSLSTSSIIQRGAPGGGAPRYDSADSFFLDGQELVPCTDLGGTHCTRIQSYQRIQWDGAAGTWIVTQKSGVRAVYTPLISTDRGVYRWGLSTLTDTHNNNVNFNYACDYPSTCTTNFICDACACGYYCDYYSCYCDPYQCSASCWQSTCTNDPYPNECYLDTITYNGNTVRFHRESRPDPMVYGRGTSTFGRMNYRLKTIEVTVGSSRVRAYTLGYRTSAASGRSLLASVQQFGRDAAIDGAGTITAGSALPAMTFTWKDAAPSFSAAQLVVSNLANNVSSASGGNNDGDNYPTISYPDINGDGKADVCWRGDAGYFCALSRGDGTFQAPVNVLWQLGNSVSNYYGGNNDGNNYPTIRNPDANGDGKSDVCWRGDAGYFCAFSNGDGTFQAPVNQFTHLADGMSSAYGGNNDGNNHPTIRTPDINGDGKSDVCWRGDSGYWCALATGTGYATPTSSVWQLGDNVSNVYGGNNDGDNHPTLNNPDINGDRRADVCWRGDNGYWCALALATGGFAAPQLVLTALGNNVSLYSGGNNDSDNYPTIRNPDINGDGLSDVCWRGDNGYWCALALGNGSFAAPQLALTALANNIATASGGDNSGDNYLTINNPDINGDGLSDVCWRGDTGYWCALSRGNGTFGTPAQMLWNLGNNVATYYGGDNNGDNYPTISNPDINGDGTADLCWRGDTGLWCALSQATQMDLVTSVQNGIGGITTVQYKPSSAWSNTYLPVGTVLQTASSITLGDGRGNSSTTNYTYQGALWSSSERRFLGFRRVQAVVDAAGNYTETYYHQHAGCIAKPELTYYRDAAGNIFSYSSYGYSENAAPPYTSLLTSRWDYECNQTASCRRILTQIGYDTYGNAITTYEYGDYDVAGDERTILRGYYPNTTKYLAAAPAYENTYSGIGTSTLVAQTLYEYDGNTTYAAAPAIGELRRKKAWNSQTGGYATTSYGYDAWGNITTETNALGVNRTTDYDPSYHVYATRKCDALGSCSTQGWDYVLGQITAITDANSLTTSYTYDALSRPARKTAPDGGYLEYSYLNWGSATTQRTRTTLWDGSADGLWKDSYQDGLGREYLVEEEGGFRKETLYSDASSRIWRESLRYQLGDAPVYRTYSYDGAGRVRFVTNPDNTSGQRVYGNGYEVVYDENNREQVLYKDAQGRTTQVRERNQGAYQYTSYTYDALGRLTRVTDAAGNATTFGWDSLGRKTSACDPDMGCWSYTYDDAGNMLTQRDAKGQTLRFAYDVLGRMTSKTYPDNQQAVWRYDEAGHGAGKGKLTSTTDPSGSESLVYDFAGRITQATKCISGTCATLSYAFDRVGRPASVTFHDGEVVSYGYDASGRLTNLSGYVSSLGYNTRGQLTSANYANGTRTTYGYNSNRMWLTSAQVQNAGGATLYQASYGYDAGARVTSMSSSTNPLSNLNLGYDELSRLTTVSGSQSQSFAYNAVGNLTSSSTMGAYGYGDTTHRHAVTAAGAQSYQYDVNGNLVLGGGRSIGWDYDNRPASITSGGQTVSFAYDTTGVRVRKSSPQGTTLYFGNLLERRPDGTWVKYIYAGPSLVARSESSGRYWYHQDHLGSVRLITDAAGTVVKRLDFAAFGKEIAQSGALTNARGYTGHVSDPETGLIYMNARYYDPDLGRFLSPDPLVPEATNPQALNRYSYVYNNPISNVDPSGHAPVVAAVFVVGSAFASGSTLAVTVALIGAATTTVGYLQKNPTLLSIGSILLGFAGGYAGGAGFLGSPGLSGGLISASIAAVTSPISPLDPSIKQAIGWAFTAQSLIKGFTSRSQTTDASGRDIQEPPGFEAIERRAQTDATNYGGDLTQDIYARLSPDSLASETAQSQAIGFYGSRTHQLYGDLVERLTNGRISAADALRLNPCGGLVGPGCGTSSRLLSAIFPSGPVYQHAILHDALGFLRTTASVGPGYTYVGFSFLAATSPLGGQLSGIFWHIPYRGWIPGISVATTLVPWSQRSR